MTPADGATVSIVLFLLFTFSLSFSIAAQPDAAGYTAAQQQLCHGVNGVPGIDTILLFERSPEQR